MRLSDMLAIKNLKIHNNSATRVTDKTQSLIDLVITNCNNTLKETLEDTISDHDTLLFTVWTSKHKTEKLKRHDLNYLKEVKLYNKINFKDLNDLIKIKFQKLHSQDCADLNKESDYLINSIHSAINELVPKKQLSNSTTYQEKPWLQNEEVR
jgi:DNA-directed RNA polymerase subunit L